MLKSIDIVADFQWDFYQFIENQASFIYIGVGIYLTIWIRMYWEILTPFENRRRKSLNTIEVFLYITSSLYGLVIWVFTFVHIDGKLSYGAKNIVKYASEVYTLFLCISFNIVGFKFLKYLKRISHNVYSSIRIEITINIICNCGLLLIRFFG